MNDEQWTSLGARFSHDSKYKVYVKLWRAKNKNVERPNATKILGLIFTRLDLQSTNAHNFLHDSEEAFLPIFQVRLIKRYLSASTLLLQE